MNKKFKNHHLIFIIFLIAKVATAQEKNDSINTFINLNEIVISVNKEEEQRIKVPNQVHVISAKQIENLNQSTSADVLQATGLVNIQKSQQGGGSPVLRGFESSRVLMVVDGVRMNNLIYRGGHLQNSITVNQNLLENIELLMGPSSTVYGSDALGGVISFYTKKPELSKDAKPKVFSSIFSKYASANNEKTGNIILGLGYKKIAFLSSFNYSDFGDLKMGKATNPFLGEQFGLRDNYVQNFNGIDSIVANDDKFVQKFSGYKQYDFLQKIFIKTSEKISHLFNFQFSNSTDIPRYDRLTDLSKGKLATAQWNYGPQKRLMGSYNFEWRNVSQVFHRFSILTNFQDIEESRITRNFGSKNKSSRIENVKVFGFVADADFVKAKNDFRVGIDFQYNNLKSTAFKTNIISQEKSSQNTRYPNGKNELMTIASYFTHKLEINEKLFLSDGVRLSYTHQNSKFIDKTFYPFPFDQAVQNVPGISANIGLVFLPSTKFKFSTIISSGFRVPNVDDLSKVFDPPANTLIVPNPKIKPEKTINLDLGFAYFKKNKFSFENTFWGTYYFDAISLAPFTFLDSDSILYNGSTKLVLANQNKSKAFLYGYSGIIKYEVGQGFFINANSNITVGKISTDSVPYPLDHIPPYFGSVSLKYVYKNISAECFNNFNGWKRVKDYNMFGEDNFVYAHPRGTPAWLIVNLRLTYLASKNIKIMVGVDNLLDTQYRTFSSGINSPGRNFIVSALLNF